MNDAIMNEQNTQETISTSARNTRLNHYCAAGAGAVVLVGAVSTADASITYINFNNQVFTDTVPDNGSSTYFTSGTAGNFDFNKDGVIDFRLRQRASANSGSNLTNLAGFAAPTTGTINVVGASNSGNNYPSRLAAGATIGTGATFLTLATGVTGYLASKSGFSASQWVSATGPATGFVGISFTAGGQLYYGWVGLSVAGQDASTPYAITLSGIAYENVPNTAIIAGQTTGGAVPEPSSVALVALGGAGLAAYRRRRAAAARSQAEG